ncbi:hypothetical protein ACFPRL_04035 [Pseudoclavibacter helvolus]
MGRVRVRAVAVVGGVVSHVLLLGVGSCALRRPTTGAPVSGTPRTYARRIRNALVSPGRPPCTPRAPPGRIAQADSSCPMTASAWTTGVPRSRPSRGAKQRPAHSPQPR